MTDWTLMLIAMPILAGSGGHLTAIPMVDLTNCMQGPENQSRPVLVTLKRSASDQTFSNALLWQASFNRYDLRSKPELVTRTIGI